MMNDTINQELNTLINNKSQQLIVQSVPNTMATSQQILYNPFVPVVPVEELQQIDYDLETTWTVDKTANIMYSNESNVAVAVQSNDQAINNQSIPHELNDGSKIISSIFLPNDIFLHLNVSQPVLTVPNEPIDFSEYFEIVQAHKCKTCGALFENLEGIVKHVREVHHLCGKRLDSVEDVAYRETRDLYLCGKCGSDSISYSSLEALKQHMISFHNFTQSQDQGEEKGVNDEAFAPIDHSYMKNLVHNQEVARRKVHCLIKGCDTSFARNDIMLKHLEYHMSGLNKRFKCLNCDKQFFIWRTCRAHVWKAHQIDVDLYECEICRSFKSLAAYDLLAHLKIHSKSKPFEPFLCSVCGLQLNRLCELQNHSNVHEQIKPKATCPVCDQSFASSKYLKRHIQTVHDQYKPFICNICGHKCARKSMLNLHLRQHTVEKPYKCDLCPFKTGDHNTFRRHVSRHSGLMRYTCKHCDYGTVQTSALKLHMKKKHPSEPGFFACTTCSFETVNENMFKNHLFKHKNEKVNTPLTEEENKVPNVEDEETQIGLFPDHLEDTVDTGGITIPAN